MLYVGVDIARERHQFCIMDGNRKVLGAGVLPHDSSAYQGWMTYVGELTTERVVVAIETRNGLATPLDQLVVAKGWRLLAVPPDAVHSYREKVLRKHSKTDANDAHTLAVLAATMVENAPETKRPRQALFQAARALEKQKTDITRTKNRLRRTMAAYWLEVTQEGSPFYRLDLNYVMLLLEKYPDPADIVRLGTKRLTAYFRRHGSSVPHKTIEAIVALAKRSTLTAQEKPVLVKLTQLYARQLAENLKHEADLEALVHELATSDEDVQRLASTQGVSVVQGAQFMAEVQDLGNFRREGCLASYAGFTLRRHQTGQSTDTKKPQMRANRHLKNTVFKMADSMRLNNQVSKAYYARKVTEGKSHRQALRALGRHILRMFWCMLRSRQDYRQPASG